MSNSENIEKYLKKYIKSFVKDFEEQLEEYKEEIDVRKSKPKEGKIAGLVNSAVGVAIPLSAAPIQKVVSSASLNKHKNKAKTVIGIFNDVEDNVLKKSLVTAGGNIFKKIEVSLVEAIENEKNYERSIEKIAHDAVDRAMHHLYSHPLENTENLSDKIVNAVFSGDSKINFFKLKKNPFRKGSKIGTTTSSNLFQTSDKEVGFLQGKSEKEFELMLLSIFLEEIDKSDESIKMQNKFNIFIKGFKEENGQNILHYAIEKDNIEMVIYILKSNQSQDLINTQDNRGATPLHYAAKSSNLEIVKLVESRDLDLNAKDNGGATPLHYAAKSGNLETVKWLAESKLDLNAKDNRGATLLHCAAKSGNLETVKWLVESKLDLNAKDNGGLTPAYYAAQSGNLEIVKWLAKSDTNFNKAKAEELETICERMWAMSNSNGSFYHNSMSGNYGYKLGFLSSIIRKEIIQKESGENNIQENMRPILERGGNHSDKIIRSRTTSSKLDTSTGKSR